MEYTVIRSRRKTVGIQIKNGRVVIRAPLGLSDVRIGQAVESRRAWIEAHLKQAELRLEQIGQITPLSEEALRELTLRAKQVIPQRVAYYAQQIGVPYGRVTIRRQRTRWGSCSSKGNLNFNCLLMLTPPQTLDSVVVHELCHRKVMNHSKAFYREVYRVFPEYDKWHGWLKQNESALMGRLGERT